MSVQRFVVDFVVLWVFSYLWTSVVEVWVVGELMLGSGAG